MLYTIFLGDKKIVGNGVSEDAVNFLGHAAVKAAKAGFDVGDANAEFHGGERDGDGGVDISDDENEIGFAFQENGLDTFQDLGSLRSVGAGTDFEVHVGRGDAHLAEENVGKLFVIVLAGVNEDGLDFGMPLHFAHKRGDFREIGAGADDTQDFQALAHGAFVFGSNRSIAPGYWTFGRP